MSLYDLEVQFRFTGAKKLKPAPAWPCNPWDPWRHALCKLNSSVLHRALTSAHLNTFEMNWNTRRYTQSPHATSVISTRPHWCSPSWTGTKPHSHAPNSGEKAFERKYSLITKVKRKITLKWDDQQEHTARMIPCFFFCLLKIKIGCRLLRIFHKMMTMMMINSIM